MDTFRCGDMGKNSVLYPIVFDNHVHLRKDGFLMDAVKRFIASGGNAINLVNLPDYEIVPSEYYERLYSNTLEIADAVRREFGITVLVTLGPYPLDYFFFERASIDPARAMRDGIDMAARFVSEGRADAIGEVGRPHFQVSDDILKMSEDIFEYAIMTSKDLDKPVIMHTEDLTEKSHRELIEFARKTGMDPRKLVKHHALPADFGIRDQMTLSTLASRSNVRVAATSNRDFLLETDYVDDRSKPDKVIPIDSVPRRAVMIKSEYEDWERILETAFIRVPAFLYGNELFNL
ncbi:MAG: TatD family hydrolase [Thermoplasmata archaeon]